MPRRVSFVTLLKYALAGCGTFLLFCPAVLFINMAFANYLCGANLLITRAATADDNSSILDCDEYISFKLDADNPDIAATIEALDAAFRQPDVQSTLEVHDLSFHNWRDFLRKIPSDTLRSVFKRWRADSVGCDRDRGIDMACLLYTEFKLEGAHCDSVLRVLGPPNHVSGVSTDSDGREYYSLCYSCHAYCTDAASHHDQGVEIVISRFIVDLDLQTRVAWRTRGTIH